MADAEAPINSSFAINEDLEEDAVPPQPRTKREAPANGEMMSESSSSSSDDDDDSDSDNEDGVNVILNSNPNQPVSLFERDNKCTMAQVLAKKVPDTTNNVIVSKPMLSAKTPDVSKQGEAHHTVYDENMLDEDKPWLKPGADISDYFNYGFDEETWKIYCEKQRMIRAGLDPRTARAILPRKELRRGNYRDFDHSAPQPIEKIEPIVKRQHQPVDPMEAIKKQAAEQALKAIGAGMGGLPATLPQIPGLPPLPGAGDLKLPGAPPGLPPMPNALANLPIPTGMPPLHMPGMPDGGMAPRPPVKIEARERRPDDRDRRRSRSPQQRRPIDDRRYERDRLPPRRDSPPRRRGEFDRPPPRERDFDRDYDRDLREHRDRREREMRMRDDRSLRSGTPIRGDSLAPPPRRGDSMAPPPRRSPPPRRYDDRDYDRYAPRR